MYQDGQTATNPQTGEKMVLQGGQWVPMGSGTPAPRQQAPGIIYRPKPVDPIAERRLDIAEATNERGAAASERAASAAERAIGNDVINQASKMRDDYNQDQSVKAFQRVLPKYVSALKSADDTAAGDLALTYAFATVMDPQSAVREGEQSMAAGGDTLYGQTVARLKKEMGEGGTFRPEYRKDLLKQMRAAGNALRTTYDTQRQRYSDLAQRAGLNPEDVVGRDPARDYGDFEYRFWNEGRSPQEDNGAKPPVPAVGNRSGSDVIDRSTVLAVSPGDGPLSTSTEMKTVKSPWLQRHGAQLGRMLASAASDAEIMDFYKESGAPIAELNVDEVLKFRHSPQFREWKRQNPNAPYPINDTMDAPLNEGEKWSAEVSQTPFAAGTVGAANALTAGFSDEIYGGINSLATGKPLDETIADADRAKNVIYQKNPGAFAAGEIGGGVAAQLGIGKALGVTGAMGTFAPRALAADVAYGSAYGAGENNEDRLSGARGGAISSVVGGALGRGAARGLAGVVAPEVDPAVRTLRDNGVRTTLGQNLGPSAAKTEEKLASVPFVGDMIKGARDASINDFQTAVVNDSLKEIGKKLPAKSAPTEAMKFAQKAFDDAYDDARKAMTLKPDQEMVADFLDLERRVTDGALDAESISRLRKIYKSQVARRMKPGGVTGDTYKEIVSGLGKLQAGTRASYPELSGAIGEMKSIVDRVARRSSTPEAAAKMDAADAGYALFTRAERAAASRGGETGGFTPLQYDAAVQKGDGSVRSKAYLRGEARGQELAEAGKKVLRDRIPNSGSADRAFMGLAAGGASIAGGLKALPALGGVAAAYAPITRDIIGKVMTRKSPKEAEAFAKWLREHSRITGAVASPLALTYQGSGK